MSTIIGLVIGITAILDRIFKLRERHRINLDVFRFSEESKKPIESSWSIRILYPNKPIEKCMVFYDDVRLPWWDNIDECYYERYIIKGGGGNVRIPKGTEKDDAKVVVKDGKKTIKKKKFKEIPIVQ